MKRLRHAHGWTRQQAAEAAGITPTTYGLVERGRPTLTSVLAAIAAAFGVSLREVLGGAPVVDEPLILQQLEATLDELSTLILAAIRSRGGTRGPAA